MRELGTALKNCQAAADSIVSQIKSLESGQLGKALQRS